MSSNDELWFRTRCNVRNDGERLTADSRRRTVIRSSSDSHLEQPLLEALFEHSRNRPNWNELAEWLIEWLADRRDTTKWKFTEWLPPDWVLVNHESLFDAPFAEEFHPQLAHTHCPQWDRQHAEAFRRSLRWIEKERYDHQLSLTNRLHSNGSQWLLAMPALQQALSIYESLERLIESQADPAHCWVSKHKRTGGLVSQRLPSFVLTWNSNLWVRFCRWVLDLYEFSDFIWLIAGFAQIFEYYKLILNHSNSKL